MGMCAFVLLFLDFDHSPGLLEMFSTKRFYMHFARAFIVCCKENNNNNNNLVKISMTDGCAGVICVIRLQQTGAAAVCWMCPARSAGSRGHEGINVTGCTRPMTTNTDSSYSSTHRCTWCSRHAPHCR